MSGLYSPWGRKESGTTDDFHSPVKQGLGKCSFLHNLGMPFTHLEEAMATHSETVVFFLFELVTCWLRRIDSPVLDRH